MNLAKPDINQANFSFSTESFLAVKVATRTNNTVLENFGQKGAMQMMDFREATNTLNAYSTSIIGKTRFGEKVSNPGASEEANKVIEELITTLEAETKEAMIISIMIMRQVARHSEQLAIGFTDELTELTEALNRSRAAMDDASKLTLAHNERSKRRDPEENPTVKAIREFQAKHGLRST